MLYESRGITVYTPPPPDKAKPLTLELLEWINSKGRKPCIP